jgi:hypothetical protein
MMVSRGSPSLVSADATTATTFLRCFRYSVGAYLLLERCLPRLPIGHNGMLSYTSSSRALFFFLRNRTSLIKAQHCYKTIQQIVLTRTGKAKRLNKLIPPLMACCARLCFFFDKEETFRL